MVRKLVRTFGEMGQNRGKRVDPKIDDYLVEPT
jgi:hypothetical protein